MRHIVALSILLLLSFHPVFSQQSEIEEAIIKEFKDLSINEIEKELSKAISEIESFEPKIFKNKTEVSDLLDKIEGNDVYIYNIAPYKEVAREDVKKALIEAYKDDVFFQYLNAIDVSFISTSDSDRAKGKIEKSFPYLNEFSYPKIGTTICRLYYADGTTEDCNYTIMGEIPTGKLITKMDVKVDYHFFANIKRVKLSDTPEYSEGDKFARLVDIKGEEVKLWLSEKIYQKGFITITTKSGKTVHPPHNTYTKRIKGFSEKAVALMREMEDGMINIHNDIINRKYTNSEEFIKEMIKIFPKNLSKAESLEYALSFKTDGDPIEAVDLILQEGKDSISITTTIHNADMMSEKTGVRLRGKTLIDNSGKVITELPFYRIEHILGLFFSGKKEENDKYETYLFDKKKKEMVKTVYDDYLVSLGKIKDYDYDFIDVTDKRTQKHGVIDLNGKIIIPTMYSNIYYEPFDQLFSVEEKESNFEDESAIEYSTGILNSEGKEILKKEYSFIGMGRYFITAYDKEGEKIYNKKGNPLLKNGWSATPTYPILFKPPMISDDMSEVEGNKLDEPLLLVSRIADRKSFFINNNGEIVLNETNEYRFYDYFYDGMAVVKKKNTAEGKEKYGYIDYKGKTIIPMVYDEANSFINGYAKVIKDDKTFYIDKLNRPFDEKPQIEDPTYRYQNIVPSISIGM